MAGVATGNFFFGLMERILSVTKHSQDVRIKLLNIKVVLSASRLQPPRSRSKGSFARDMR